MQLSMIQNALPCVFPNTMNSFFLDPIDDDDLDLPDKDRYDETPQINPDLGLPGMYYQL